MSGIPKNQVKSVNTIQQAEHEDDLNAKRVTWVGSDGISGIGTTPDNPIHVQLSDGSINIGTVNAEVEMQLSHIDNSPDPGDVADSVRIGDGVEELAINPDGSISIISTNGTSALDVRTDIVNNITYIGISSPGAATSDPVWRITRTETVFNNDNDQEDVTTLAAGTGDFDQIWDDRESLFPAITPIDFFDRRFERLLPILTNANWMVLGDFDQVIPTFNVDSLDMNYYQNLALIGKATVRYVNELDWQIDLARYINDDDGSLLLDDDDTNLLLD